MVSRSEVDVLHAGGDGEIGDAVGVEFGRREFALEFGVVGDTNPFAASTVRQTAAPISNPYQAAPTHGYYGPQHRGGMILTFGILSWVGCVFGCFLINLGFAIAAWTMGRTDLEAMRAGRMDPSGQSATQAGMILGIVGTVLILLGLVLIVIWLLLVGLAVMAQGFP